MVRLVFSSGLVFKQSWLNLEETPTMQVGGLDGSLDPLVFRQAQVQEHLEACGWREGEALPPGMSPPVLCTVHWTGAAGAGSYSHGPDTGCLVRVGEAVLAVSGKQSARVLLPHTLFQTPR